MITIDVINESTVSTDADLQTIMAALQIQVDRDFRPAWGMATEVVLNFIPKGGTPRLWTWWLVIADNSDQAGALGYHDITPQDQPVGFVFAQTDLTFGSSLSVTMSHELLEMLGDSRINRMVMMSDGLLFMFEACDAVEADGYGYLIGNVLVSDFVLLPWFDPTGKGPYDFRNVLQGPCPTLAPGGYIGYLNPHTGNWGQVEDKAATAQEKFRHRAHLGSRRVRRQVQDRVRSTAHTK